MDWAALIRRVRRHKLMTQSDLAAALDVSQGTVSRWESGLFEPELRYQSLLRDFLRENRPDLETRMIHAVQRSLFPVTLAGTDHTLLAASQRFQKLMEIEVPPDKPVRIDGTRLSPGARRILERDELAGWLYDVAYISFLTGIVTPSGQRFAARELWTPFLLEGARLVVRIELEPLNGGADDPSLFEDDPPIEVVYLGDY